MEENNFRDTFPHNWPIVMMAILGKMCVTATFAIIYLYSCEIYPTVVRSVGVSSSSVFARVGGAVAPFVGSLDKVRTSFQPCSVVLMEVNEPCLRGKFCNFYLFQGDRPHVSHRHLWRDGLRRRRSGSISAGDATQKDAGHH